MDRTTRNGVLLILIFLSVFNQNLAQITQHNLIFIPLELQGEGFNKKVNVLFEDARGHLWIGTNSGLYRYDGNHLKSYQYDVFDEHSIPNNSVNFIVEDEFHNLWLGNESYLIRFDRRKEQFKGFYKNRATIGLFCSKTGTIWASLRKEGLIKIEAHENIDSLQFSKKMDYSIANGSNYIEALIEDDFDRLIGSTQKGLLKLSESGNWESTNLKMPIGTIQKGKNQTFWLTSDRWIYQVQYSKRATSYDVLRAFEIPSLEFDFKITDILLSPKSELWIGTNYGLYQLNLLDNQPHIQKINDEKGLLNNGISSLQLDQYQNLWVGNWKGLVKYIDRANMFRYTDLKHFGAQMENDQVKAVYEDEQGTIWLGTDQSGLIKLDHQTKEKTVFSLPIKNIGFIKKDKFGEALLIAADNKLYRLTNLKQAKPKLKLLFENDRLVTDLLQISTKETWIGTWEGGLHILDEEKLIPEWKKSLQNRLQNDHISVMYQDAAQRVWIGTRGEGLYLVQMDQELFQNFQPSLETGIHSNAFLCMTEDQNGNIWMGTRGGGLIQYDPESKVFQPFSQKDGLPSNIIVSVEVDQKNNIWFTTESGLGMYHRLDDRYFSFSAEDGLFESSFLYNSSCTNNGNLLYFGAFGGFYQVDVEGFERKTVAPVTVINSFSTYGDLATETDNSFALLEGSRQVCLPFKKNNISIGFSSLDLTAPNKNKYAYQLEGVNNYWIYPEDNSRNAVYFDLSHGDYTFKVKSSNSDGVWSEEPAILQVTILPPFYLTNAAYGVYALLALGIGILLFLMSKRWYQLKKNLFEQRISRQKDLQHHKMRMVLFTDISHELRTPLTLILSTLEYLIKQGQLSLKPVQLNRIYKNGLKMKALINQVMDIRKHSEGEFKLKVHNFEILAYLKNIVLSFRDVAQYQGITLNFSSTFKQLDAYLDPLITEKIISNLLSNALKYTPKSGNINVDLDQIELDDQVSPDFTITSGRFLQVFIKDTGIGMDEEDLMHIFDRYYQSKDLQSAHLTGTGIGMELVYKLIKLHRGAIFVKSKKGDFTAFRVLLPIESQQYKVNELTSSESLQMPINPSVLPLVEPIFTSDPSMEVLPFQKCDLLIVEDNRDLRETMVEILSKQYRVAAATNGKEGLLKAKELQPKLIISDILMPEMDGMDFLAALKKEVITKHIPVFLLTAKVNKEVRQESIQLGATDFIEKPFSMDFLYWKIKNTLSHEAEMQEKYSKKIKAIPANKELESPDERMIKDLIQLIEENIATPHLSVAFLAAEVGMSRANLYRKVQKIINDTPVSFIKKIRLERAKQILEMDKFYISEVAYMCGFKTQKYFSKCFQKAFGYSPSAYVKAYNKKQIEETSTIN